ncbi:phage tail assembly chaperone [Pseudomonas sp. B21-015]|uniref:phage tail assembly chaperone n=1 Tax=Pseudomonas sp. B21-015 TaxID=2895473 RepID=UPI00215FCB9D|nr:phage tail assembly chaperone [Pseudomonas sp. B21-015]UVM48561.1 phage tail assembly chaperone [Pseudomonas sp. B21-015]
MWAHIESGRVIEVTDIDPAGRYHASWVWKACPAAVGLGWTFSSGTFSPPAGLSAEALAASERFWRDSELAGNEWLVARHRDEQDMGEATTLATEQFSALLVYRKQLRDWPEGSAFPESAGRPVAPDWLATIIVP